MKTVRAAGGLLWRQATADALVAVVHRPRYDDWSLPKGKLEPEEHPLLAGYREVIEETGHQPIVERRLPRQRYDTDEGEKIVEWWSMRSAGGTFSPNHEIDELRWLEPEAADQLLSYRNDKELISAFTSVPQPTAMVLLVRHARAGDRLAWQGEDRDRPLDKAGKRQAQRLAEVLPVWRPTRIGSADLLRCTQTIEPLADRLGLTVQLEETLSERAFALDPDAALERVRTLAGCGGVNAICSQGGAIPSIVAQLADSDGVPLDEEISAKKGSTWVLAFNGRKLIGADYYRNFKI